LKKILFLFTIALNFFSAITYSQQIVEQGSIEELRKLVIEELILSDSLEEKPLKDIQGSILIAVSDDLKLSVEIFQKLESSNFKNLPPEIIESFTLQAIALDLSVYRKCVLVFPFILRVSKIEVFEKRMEEVITEILPEQRFENVSCVEYQAPYIGKLVP